MTTKWIEGIENLALDAEEETGSTEYKFKLTNLTDEQIMHLSSQMACRLEQGNGECFYDIGVTDDGGLIGLSDEKMQESLDNLKKIANEIGADICSVYPEKIVHQNTTEREILSKFFGFKERENDTRTYKYGPETRGQRHFDGIGKNDDPSPRDITWNIAEVHIRYVNLEDNYIEVKIATAGRVDAGKSTLIGVLSRGTRDNGKGSARTYVSKHPHEIEQGRTSSVGMEIMGFDENGNSVCDRDYIRFPSWKELTAESNKIITFLDLAGHEKYIKTAVKGFCSHPDYGMICLGGNKSTIDPTTKSHITMCQGTKCPMFIVITKTDISPEHVLDELCESVSKICKTLKKVPYNVSNERDALVAAHNMPANGTVPIFKVSNVSGQGLDLLKIFLNTVPARTDFSEAKLKKPVVSISDTFFKNGIGLIVSGTILTGVINVGDTMLLGPFAGPKLSPGIFKEVVVKSIERKRTGTNTVHAGYDATFAIKSKDSKISIKRNDVRKGMVLVDPRINGDAKPTGIWKFHAEILIQTSQSTQMGKGYQPVIQVDNIQQSVEIVEIEDIKRSKKPLKSGRHKNLDINKQCIYPGDYAKVIFQFNNRPEWIHSGQHIIIREGKTKGLGIIRELIPVETSSI